MLHDLEAIGQNILGICVLLGFQMSFLLARPDASTTNGTLPSRIDVLGTCLRFRRFDAIVIIANRFL
jgi:hypothetical protein